MRKRNKRWWLTIFILLGCIVLPVGYIAHSNIFYAEWSYESVAEKFLRNAVEGKEEAALVDLSADLKSKVKRECPGGLVTKCIERVVSPSWGKLEDIQVAVYQPSIDSLLIYTFWSNLSAQAIPVVIITNKVNGKWVIQGWKGFIDTKSEEGDGNLLWYGHDNEFWSGR